MSSSTATGPAASGAMTRPLSPPGPNIMPLHTRRQAITFLATLLVATGAASPALAVSPNLFRKIGSKLLSLFEKPAKVVDGAARELQVRPGAYNAANAATDCVKEALDTDAANKPDAQCFLFRDEGAATRGNLDAGEKISR